MNSDVATLNLQLCAGHPRSSSSAMSSSGLDSGEVCLVNFDPDEITSVQEVSHGMDCSQMQAPLVRAE